MYFPNNQTFPVVYVWIMKVYLSYLYNFRVCSHFQGDTGAKGKAQHGNPAAEDLRMLLQDSIGRLQQENTSENKVKL